MKKFSSQISSIFCHYFENRSFYKMAIPAFFLADQIWKSNIWTKKIRKILPKSSGHFKSGGTSYLRPWLTDWDHAFTKDDPSFTKACCKKSSKSDKRSPSYCNFSKILPQISGPVSRERSICDPMFIKQTGPYLSQGTCGRKLAY